MKHKLFKTLKLKSKKPKKVTIRFNIKIQEFDLSPLLTQSQNKFLAVKSVHFMSESPRKTMKNSLNMRIPFISKIKRNKYKKLERKWKNDFARTLRL